MYILLVIVIILLVRSYKLEKKIEELEKRIISVENICKSNRTPVINGKKENLIKSEIKIVELDKITNSEEKIHKDKRTFVINGNEENPIKSEAKTEPDYIHKKSDAAIKAQITFPEAVEILGMRVPKKFNIIRCEGKEQYIKECRRNQLNVDSHLNICMMLPVLDLKGFHIELIKNGMEKINFSTDEELASLKWHQKYDKIIFDSNISGAEFCNCIRKIMKAHYFTETDSYHNGLSISQIEERNSYSIWQALYAMQYYIKLNKTNEEYTKYRISNSQMLIERNYNEMSDLWNDIPTLNKKHIEEFAKLAEGQGNLTDSKITIDKGMYGLIYKDDILKGYNRFFYNDSTYYFVYPRYIVFTNSAPFYGSIWKGNTSSCDGYILADGILGINLQETEGILIQYLFMILKLVFSMLNKFSENNKVDLHLSANIINQLEFVYPCRLKQYMILKELNDRHLTEADDIIAYLMEKEQWDIISNVESMADTIIELQSSHMKESTSIKTEYYGSSYSFGSTYLKGYFRKNGSYVTGHFRRK